MIASFRQSISNFFHKMGYTIIPNWRLERFPATQYLKRLFHFLAIDCVLDVGANAGQYAGFLRNEVGYGGLILSFEPVPHLVAELQKMAAGRSDWFIHGHALGQAAGKMTFNITANTEFSSFLKPGKDSRAFSGLNDIVEQATIDVRTLDQIVPEILQRYSVSNIYLKLDTQGFDLEVLNGGLTVLDSIAGMQSEISIRPIYEGMPDYRQVIDFIQARNFVLSQFMPNNAGHFPALYELDCYAINRKWLADGGDERP